jgi:hypothetical protein
LKALLTVVACKNFMLLTGMSKMQRIISTRLSLKYLIAAPQGEQPEKIMRGMDYE